MSAGYEIPISVSLSNASGNDTSLGLNNYVDFGDGGLFAPSYGAPTQTQDVSASSAASLGGNASSAAAAGAGGTAGLPAQVGGISTTFLLIIAAGAAAFYILRKKL
jgi:hypothetical protein